MMTAYLNQDMDDGAVISKLLLLHRSAQNHAEIFL